MTRCGGDDPDEGCGKPVPTQDAHWLDGIRVQCATCADVMTVLALPEVCPHDGGPLTHYVPPRLVLVTQGSLL